jgi:hypothetical protein
MLFTEDTIVSCLGEKVTVETAERKIVRGYTFYGQGNHEAYVEVKAGEWDEVTVIHIIRDGGELAQTHAKK